MDRDLPIYYLQLFMTYKIAFLGMVRSIIYSDRWLAGGLKKDR